MLIKYLCIKCILASLQYAYYSRTPVPKILVSLFYIYRYIYKHIFTYMCTYVHTHIHDQGRLGRFYVLFIVNNAAVNMEIQTSL